MIYGVGESVLDILFREDQPQKAVPGGSAFNSMIALGRHHLPAAMLTQVGDDHVGEITLDYMRSHGVATDLVCRAGGMQSHVSLAFLDAQGDAHYSFYKDHRGWNTTALMAAAERVVFTHEDVLLLGSFFAVNPLVRPVVSLLLHRAHEAGALIYYDLNYRQPHAAQLAEVRPYIEENMRLATVVRGSTDDMRIVYQEEDIERLYSRIGALCGVLILTDGAGPVRVCRGQDRVVLPTPPVTPVSTVGAGDNFNAGFIAGYLQQYLTPDTAQWTPAQLTEMTLVAQAYSLELVTSKD